MPEGTVGRGAWVRFAAAAAVAAGGIAADALLNLRFWSAWVAALPRMEAPGEAVLSLEAGEHLVVREGVEAWFAAGVRTPILVPSSAAGGQMKAFEEMFAAFA